MKIFSLEKYPVEEKTVFLRLDLNVPIRLGKITDHLKITKSLPTIRYLLKRKCKIIIGTHLGRPEGKHVAKLSTKPIAKALQVALKEKVLHLNDCLGVKDRIAKSKYEIFLLENLRYYKEEESNNKVFAHALAGNADILVNDAFAVCHRSHASVSAITKFLPSIAGLQIQEEISNLSQALDPQRPAIWILGGAKLNKIGLIKQAFKKADYILVGGALVFSFLKAQGKQVGMSKTDASSVRLAKKVLKHRRAKKIILATDFLVTDKFSSKSKVRNVRKIGHQDIALDIGPESIKLFKHYLRKVHTVFWNGPLGYFEWAQYAKSTKEIGRQVGKLTATSICGGGETASAMRKFQLDHNFTHVSTGGGAAIAFISGEKMPGLNALVANYRRFMS